MIPCLLTFDIEDWFQVENLRPLFPPDSWETIPRRVASSTRRVLRLLAEHQIRSTFFVLGWVAEREPALVREIAAGGHEIASHGHGHVMPMQLTLSEFRDDVVRARKVLEEVDAITGPAIGRPKTVGRTPDGHPDFSGVYGYGIGGGRGAAPAPAAPGSLPATPTLKPGAEKYKVVRAADDTGQYSSCMPPKRRT